MKRILNEVKAGMDSALDHFRKELKNLRSGRANPGILDEVRVEVYGSQMRIKELGTITVPESRQLLVTPFDPQTGGAIAKAIEKHLNMQAMVDGKAVRVPVPSLNEETRKDIVKQAKKRSEEAKVAIREVRRKGNETAKKMKADGDIAEDEQKKAEKEVQNLTDKYCKDIDTFLAEKEKELLEV